MNWLAERKLSKVKTIMSFAQSAEQGFTFKLHIYRQSNILILKNSNTYMFCTVTGKLDGMLPPIWLLLRSLPKKQQQKHQ